MSKDTKQTTDAPAVRSTDLLARLGFKKGTGWDNSEVWTNTESEWMTQVWVYTSGEFKKSDLNYDAREGFNFPVFFKWWEEVSRREHYQPIY